MYLSTWTYPWDVARLGVDTVLADLARHGIAGIDLAATYHPISAVSPRGPHLTPFFSPAGAVFFPAQHARYARIMPHVWPDARVVGTWPAVAERLGTYGLELHAWTICLFQPWLAQQHPDTARVYATGEALDTGVCASNPDVRAYLRALVGDLVDQFPIGVVKLEGIAPPRYDYGWTRRRVYVGLTPAQEHALSLCFCAACRARAEDRGLDVDGVRAAALAVLATERTPADEAAGLLRDYQQVARDASTSLVRELGVIVHRARRRLAVPTPIDGTAPGVAIDDVIDEVDVVMLAGLPRDRAALDHTVDVLTAKAPRPSLEYFLHPPFTGQTAGGLPTGIDEDLADPHFRGHVRPTRRDRHASVTSPRRSRTASRYSTAIGLTGDRWRQRTSQWLVTGRAGG